MVSFVDVVTLMINLIRYVSDCMAWVMTLNDNPLDCGVWPDNF